MKSFRLLSILAGILALTALTACQEEVEDPFITVEGEKTVHLTEAQATLNVKVTSNRDWGVRLADKAKDWIVVEPSSGKASKTATDVTITVLANTGANRATSIEFYTGTASEMMTIEQDGPGGDADDVESLTVDEFIKKADKTKYYRLEGKVSSFSASYCSFDLTDATGTIYVYSVSESSKAQWVDKIKNGGTVKLQGQYEYYEKKSQHEVINAIIEEFTAGEPAPEGNPEGEGTETSPYNVAAACQAVKNLTWTDKSTYDKVGPYYVKGKVCAISQDYTYNVSDGRTYGNARFSISDDGGTTGEQLTLYNLNYLCNKKFTAGQTDIKLNDVVVIYAELMNYQGNTPENTGGYLFSLNGETGQTDVPPAEAVTGTVTEVIAMADDTAIEIPEATVAAKSKVGLVVTDGTSNVYIYFKSGETVPEVEIGDKVKVEATKTTYGGVPELTTATVTKISAGTMNYPEPKDLNPIATTYETSVTEFVKLTGKLIVSGNYYNVEIPGVDSATKMGSISNPIASLAEFDGKDVTVTGYFTGFSSNGKYINIVAVEVGLADPDAKYCTVDPAAINVKADATSATFKVQANAAWTAVSDNADFTVAPASGDGDADVTVTFAANTGDAPKVANIKVTCAAAGVEAIVTVTQAKPASGNQTVISIDFTKEISDLPQAKANGKQDGTYTLEGYQFTMHAADLFYQAKSSDLFYLLIGKKDSYIQLPAVEGKALTKVEFLTGAGASVSVIVDMAKSDGTRLNVNTGALNKGTEYTWEVPGVAGEAYRIMVCSAHNAQFQNLTLTYE